MLHAPSSSEYSEWTCRCATVGVLIGVETIGVAADATRASGPARPAICGVQNASMSCMRPSACGASSTRAGSTRTSAGRCSRPAAWAAAAEANATWAAMDELLDATGARVAALCGARGGAGRAGRVGGDRAGVGACIARGDGARRRRRCRGYDAVVLMQRGHEYKYARCATLAGARVRVGGRHRGGARARWRLRGPAPGAPRRRGAAAAVVAPLGAGRRRAGGGRRGLPELPAVRAGALVDGR